MCIGVPMQLLADGNGRATCEGRGQREALDLMLVGASPVAPGCSRFAVRRCA